MKLRFDKKMKLSIIIPMYNAGKYIGNCLDSLLNQGLSIEDYEVIIVNDGSTDNSEQIVQDYMKRYSQIYLFSQKNGGQSKARNKGLSLARGEYVCFVDADDCLIEKSLGYIVKQSLKENLQIIVYQVIGGMKSRIYPASFLVGKVQTGIKFVEKHNFNNSACGYLVQKKFLIDNDLKFIEGRFCEDGMFTLNAFLKADRMAAIDADVYCYIIRPNSTITNKNSLHLIKMADDFQYAINYINELIIKHKSVMTVGCYDRCISRRNSYIFYLLIRMLKAKMDKEYIDTTLDKLRKKGFYPYQRMLKEEYGGWKITFIHYITNHSVLYKTACALYRILK